MDAQETIARLTGERDALQDRLNHDEHMIARLIDERDAARVERDEAQAHLATERTERANDHTASGQQVIALLAERDILHIERDEAREARDLLVMKVADFRRDLATAQAALAEATAELERLRFSCPHSVELAEVRMRLGAEEKRRRDAERDIAHAHAKLFGRGGNHVSLVDRVERVVDDLRCEEHEHGIWRAKAAEYVELIGRIRANVDAHQSADTVTAVCLWKEARERELAESQAALGKARGMYDVAANRLLALPDMIANARRDAYRQGREYIVAELNKLASVSSPQACANYIRALPILDAEVGEDG